MGSANKGPGGKSGGVYGANVIVASYARGCTIVEEIKLTLFAATNRHFTLSASAMLTGPLDKQVTCNEPSN